MTIEENMPCKKQTNKEKKTDNRIGKGKKKYNKLNEYTNICMPEIRSFRCDQLKGNFSNAPNVTTCSKPTTSVYFFSRKHTL